MAELLLIDTAQTNAYAQAQIGQSVTPDALWTIESVVLENFKAGAADTAYCNIWDTSGGTINASVAESGGQAVTDSYASVTFTFGTPYLLPNLNLIWFVFKATGSPGTYWTAASVYSGGTIGYTMSTPDDAWTPDVSGEDFAYLQVNGTLPVVGGHSRMAVARSLLRRRR
jgi:hypothetical protein